MTIPLTPGYFFHVYNRGNNRETLFRRSENYRFFLERYRHHIFPVAETYAYCLLPNHFHLLLRIRKESDPIGASRAFSNLFNGYSKALNERFGRAGSLFQKPFRRKRVDDDRYALALVCYIHHNPQRHGLVTDFRRWPWSSYAALISTRPTDLDRDQLLGWFDGSVNAFIAAHEMPFDPTTLRVMEAISAA